MAVNYDIKSLVWNPNHSVFQPLTAYAATVVLEAHATFEFIEGITPIVNQGTPSVGMINRPGAANTLTFTVTFPVTGAIDIPSVEITGFIYPQTGEIPITVSDLTAVG